MKNNVRIVVLQSDEQDADECARQLRQPFDVVCAADDGEEKTPEDKSVDEKISSIFLDIDFPSQGDGYSYLREGVKIIKDDPSKIGCITKKIHPKLALLSSADEIRA